ncbi:MAG: bifunctional 5,10-methylenetetrahydrofolate dehydrogenase/5,10-methenyltetrahydrofolate cyclohydrolase [Actinobacteria bacterium]|nr:bifunctional 5,10-methylenetetrahydrofolate dehydrogenase/5,10-methenyltetrahydrofolate cyclohydrolase [Actinomycetota bacterium]MSW61012.1 bifunctional 5,10-methylenetetrahydrofolate dehydrogenase/5,10-methenyltetrahydrofolate cyclohydrolase [Actinomycetota bacterium]MSY44536.1 bifunctional 5,10-methylenetetrahydrofolate dehydrogenase/5,10-methenyltetrahydrofolate cyclohydrolase [Actinomycetota bacterium]
MVAAKLLDGTALLETTKAQLATRVASLGERGITPGLGTILVGSDPNSHAYVRGKRAACEEIGMVSRHTELPESVSPEDLHATIADYNSDPAVDAFIVQLPLPSHLDEEAALLAIEPDKDADGLHPVNLGRLVMGVSAPRPCTPLGIQTLLATNGVEIAGRHVVIVGRGLTIGRPLALLLTLKEPHANAAVTVVHTGVDDLGQYTRTADILIAAAGRASIITPDMVRSGAAVVSAGITMDGRRLIPDVDEAVGEVAGWITPRLGGVGPTTIAMLLANAVAAAERKVNG